MSESLSEESDRSGTEVDLGRGLALARGLMRGLWLAQEAFSQEFSQEAFWSSSSKENSPNPEPKEEPSPLPNTEAEKRAEGTELHCLESERLQELAGDESKAKTAGHSVSDCSNVDVLGVNNGVPQVPAVVAADKLLTGAEC